MKRKMTPKSLTVVSTEKISHSFQRITLTGDDLKKMPENCAGDYVKLMFTPQGDTDLSTLNENERPAVRTYTIRSFDSESLLMELDFVLHGEDPASGIASHWAQNAKVGDTISIGGPGHSQTISYHLDDYLFVADMTSLPALAVTLEQLDCEATGNVIVQVNDESDIQTLSVPTNMNIEWVVGDAKLPLLVTAAEKITQQATGVWCACEFSQMRAIRRSISDRWSCERENTYFSSYWKEGVTEDGHKALKREDAEAFLSDRD